MELKDALNLVCENCMIYIKGRGKMLDAFGGKKLIADRYKGLEVIDMYDHADGLCVEVAC